MPATHANELDAVSAETALVAALPRLSRSIERMLGGTAPRGWTCDDVLQETALRALEAFRRAVRVDVRDLDAWLLAIARNGVRSRLRRAVVEGALDFDPADAAREAEPERATCGSESRASTVAALRRVCVERRGALVLRDLMRRDWVEVAALLDRPSPKAARALHERARRGIASSLAPRGGGERVAPS